MGRPYLLVCPLSTPFDALFAGGREPHVELAGASDWRGGGRGRAGGCGRRRATFAAQLEKWGRLAGNCLGVSVEPPRLTNSRVTNRQVDMGAVAPHFVMVKQTRPAREPKTKGTLIVDQHRPVMNKLTDAQRQQLMRAGMELIYGTPAAPQPARRRR
jgi:hypothetical protein